MKSKHNFATWISAAILTLSAGLALLFGCAPAQVEEKRTVTFMNGDEIFNVQQVALGEKYEFPAETPTREQPDDEHLFEFVGWTLDPNYYEYRSEILEEPDYVAGDLVIYAAFRTVKISDLPDGGADLEYNVEFRMPRGEDFGALSGTTISSCTVKRYGSAAKPAEDEMPQITGYHFTGEWEGGALTDIRGHRRVTAVYAKNVYNYVWHYLGETSSAEVEFRDPVDLTQAPQVSSAFVFDGWFMDEERTVKATLSEIPAQDLHLYAKYHVDFSTASVTTEGNMIYGDQANKFYVSGLSYAEGLQYTFVWTVNGSSGAATEESRYPVKNAGVYNVGVHILADYHNGVLKDEGDASDENGSNQFRIELQKATLSAEVTLNTDSVVYGSPVPVVNKIVYSGFQFGETQEEVGVTQNFIYRRDGAEVGGAKLHVGSYTIETIPGELPNYKFAAIDSPTFTVTQKDLTVTMSVDDYGYGEGFAPQIGFSGFEYEEDEDVLGGHWFTLADTAELYTAEGDGVFYEQDLLHAGNHTAILNGYVSDDYNVILPDAAQFTVSKRTASATLSAEGGVYGVIPQINYSLENVLEDDKQRFVSSYAYTRNGNAYNPVEERFIVGSYNVVATFTETGFGDYEQLPAAEDGFTITQKELKVTAQVAHSYVYGEAIHPKAEFEQGAFEFGENENTPDLVQGAIGFTYRTKDGTEYVLNRHTVNDYTVEVKGISALNYKFIIEKTGFTVTPAELLLTVRLASDSILYGEVPAPSAEEGYYRGVSYSGFVYDDSVVSVFGVGDSLPSIVYMQNGEEAESFHAGTYVATTSATPKNYNVTVKTATLTVNPRTLYVGVAVNGSSLEYGNKPVATICYEREGYNGFYGGEQSLYTSGAYVEYAGDVTYTQSELNAPGSKMAAGSYLLSVKGIGNLKDYVITYGHEETPVSFEITPKELTVTASAEDFTYGERELPAPTLSYSGFVYGENEEVLGGVPAYSYTRDGEEYQSVYFDAGNYSVSANALTSANYCFRFVSGSFTVHKRNAAVTVSATGATYGDVPAVTHSSTVLARDVAGFGFEYVYTFSRTAANDYSEYDPDDYAYYQAGNYRVTVEYTQNQNYNPLQVNAAAFGISKKQIEVGVTNVSDFYEYGSVPAPGLTFKGFAGNENEFTEGIFTAQPQSSLSYSTAQGFGTTAARLNAGNYFVAPAEGYVSANYKFVYEEKIPFAVTAKPLTVTVSVNDITYGEAPAPKLGYTEFAYDETASVLSGSAIYEYGGEKSASGYYRAGDHTVEVSGLSSGNYQITFVGDTFTVHKRSLDVGVSVDDFVYGGTPAPEPTFGGFAEGESSDDLAGELTYIYSGNLENGVYHAGKYTVEIGGCTSDDYAITFTADTFTVTPKDLTFSLSVGDIVYGENPTPQLTYSGFIEGEDLKNLGGELIYDYSGEKSASGNYRAGEHTLTVYGYTSTDYAITYPQGVAFTVSPRNVTLALNGGWDIYANDPGDYDWYTCGGDEILGNELTFSVSATQNGKYYAINSEKYFSVGDYVITVSRNKNADYVVLSGGSVVEEQASLSFTVARKPLTISVNGDSEPWSKRADWSYTPSISDDRFTLEGVIVLNTDREIGAATYIETSIGQTFKWQNGFSIKADGKAVTGNFAISYILRLTLSNSGFSVKVPENTEYVYNAVERSFPVTATADGISAGDITHEYRVGDSGGYVSTVPAFTNAGEYKVYYKISAQNTEPAEGDFTVKISKAEISVTAPNDITATFDAQNHFVGLTKVGGVEADKNFNGSITYGRAKDDCNRNTLTVVNAADSCTVHYKVTAGENYNETTGSYKITINKANLTVTNPPDVETCYDKSNHFAEVEQVEGVAGDSEFAFAVSYGRSADKCTEESLSFVSVSDSGAAYYKVTAGENYNEATGSYTVTISKAVVAVPQIAHKTYNKALQTAAVEESALYTVKINEGGTSAGEYQVVLALADPANYRWNTSQNTELTLSFVIDRAQLSKPLASQDEFRYNSESHTYIPQGFMAETMTVNGNEQTSAGEHTVIVNLADKQNYEWADGGQDELTFAFTIAKADYNVKKVTDSTDLVYNNTPQGRSKEELKALVSVYGSDGFEVEFTSASTAVKAGAVPVGYKVFGNENYNDYSGSYQLTINRATPKVTLPEESRVLTYDATRRNDVFAAALGYADTYADDDCTVKFGVEKSDGSSLSFASEIVWVNSLAEAMDICNAGSYIIYVKIYGANYNTVEESFTVTINKAQSAINTEGIKKEYTYNGALQTVESGATYTGDGALTYSGNTFKDVPKDGRQTVTVTLGEGENYLGASAQFEIIINRAPLSLGEVEGISGLTYNGGDQYSENGSNIYGAVSGAVAEETAQNAIAQIAYAQAECKNAGEHTISFELTASANYRFPEGENKGSYTITINKADLTVTNPPDVETCYDKSNHFAEVEQVEGVAGDSEFAFAVSYGRSADKCTEESLSFVSVSDSGAAYYKVTAGENYNEATGSYQVKINPRAVTVTLPKDIVGIYNGTEYGGAGITIDVDEDINDIATVSYEVQGGSTTKTAPVFTDAISKTSVTVTAIPASNNYTFKGDNGNYTGVYTVTISKAILSALQGDITEGYNAKNKFAAITADKIGGLVNGDEFSVTYSSTQTGLYTSEEPTFVNVRDSGDVWYKIAAGKNYEELNSTYKITITPAKLTRPTAVERTYIYDRGNEIEFELNDFNADTMNISGNKQKKANESGYTVSVSLKNDENYEWSTPNDGSTTDVISFTFKIYRAKYTQGEVTVPQISQQTNRFNKTLNDIKLPQYFFWENSNSPLVLGNNDYNAYYNADIDNYENYDIAIAFTTVKEQITITKSGNGIIESELNKDPDVSGLLKAFAFKGEGERELTGEELGDITHEIRGNYSKDTGSTYLIGIVFGVNDNVYYELKEDAATEFDGVLKVTSVEVDGKLHTIEDALYIAASGQTITVKGNTSFAEKDTVAQKAGYVGGDYYTVKKDVTLLLPYDANGNYGNREGTEAAFADSSKTAVDSNLVYILSIADNITLTVNGMLNIGGIVGHTGTGLSAHTSGKYSQILMYGNTKIVLDDAIMNLYGYIKTPSADTQASVEANGATKISAPFVIYDYRGGTNTVGSYKDGLNIGDLLSSLSADEIKITNPTISPFSVYDMPNIQATLKITHSATLIGLVDLYTSDPAQHNTADVTIIAANNAIINLTGASSYLLARYTPGSYDATRGGYTVNNSTGGRTKLEIHGDANLGSMTLTMRVNLPVLGTKKVNVSTAEVYFPVSWKYDIVIAEGTATIGTKVKFITGSSVTVNDGTALNITADTIFYREFNDTSTISPQYPSKSPATLKVNGSVVIDAPLGGIITSDTDGAKIVANNIGSVTSREGYGTKTGSNVSTEFKFNEVASITEAPRSQDADGTVSQIIQGTWYYHNNAWIAPDRGLPITYLFKLRQPDGSITDVSGAVENPNPSTYTTSEFILQNAESNGLTFFGWYTAEDCNKDSRIVSFFGKDYLNGVTVYGLFAKVEENQKLTIKYHTDYPGAGEKIVIADETVLLENIASFTPDSGKYIESRDYDAAVAYYFGGWFMDPGYGVSFSTEELQKQEGGAEVTLYAKWETKVTLSVTLVYQNNYSAGFLGMGGHDYYAESPAVVVAYGDREVLSATFRNQNDKNNTEHKSNVYSLYFKPSETITVTFKHDNTEDDQNSKYNIQLNDDVSYTYKCSVNSSNKQSQSLTVK